MDKVGCCKTVSIQKPSHLHPPWILGHKSTPLVHGLIFDHSKVKLCTCGLHFYPKIHGRLLDVDVMVFATLTISKHPILRHL